MSRNEIKKQLDLIIYKFCNIHFMNNKILQDTKLTGGEVGLKGRDLLELLVLVEKQFMIRVPDKAIELGDFNSFNNIAEIIYRQLL